MIAKKLFGKFLSIGALVGCLAIQVSTTQALAQRVQQAPANGPANDVLEAQSGDPWRNHAREREKATIFDIEGYWERSLAAARSSAEGPELADEGDLLDPNAGRSRAYPAPGVYSCRKLQIGPSFQGGLGYLTYPHFRCRIWNDNGLLKFEKLTGSQRMAGVIFADHETRSIFLGTQALGDETGFPRYGASEDRDHIAVVERIANKRWRMVFPDPDNRGRQDILELLGPYD